MKSELAAKRFFLTLLFASAILFVMVLAPLWEALFMAAVLAGALWPLNKRLSQRMGKRRGLAAAVILAGVVVLIVGPLVGMSAFVFTEARAGVKFVNETVKSDGVQGLLEKLPAPLRKLGTTVLEQLPKDAEGDVDDKSVGQSVTAQGGRAAAVLGNAMSATGSIVFHVAMLLIALYFLLVQGEELIIWLDKASPLRVGQTRELLAEFKKVSYAVLMSSVITSAVQAVAAFVGYLIARVPHPIFFAFVTFFVAFIPAIGAGAVCLAASLLLVVTGHPYPAIFLGIWGVVVVGLVDNVIKPYLIKGDVEMDGAIVFFALLGGLAAFGAVGLLVGPLAVALFLALMRMYHRDFSAPVPQPVVPTTNALKSEGSGDSNDTGNPVPG